MPGKASCSMLRRAVNAERLGLLSIQVSEISLRFNRGGAALSGSSDGLSVDRIGHVSSGEYSREICLRAFLLKKIAVRVHLNLPFEWFGVWRVADRYENTLHFKCREF